MVSMVGFKDLTCSTHLNSEVFISLSQFSIFISLIRERLVVVLETRTTITLQSRIDCGFP